MVLEEKEVKKFEAMLVEQKKKLEDDLSIIAKKTSDKGDYETRYDNIGDDMDENASEVEEYVDNMAVESSLEEQLKGVDRALDKIKDGTYGSCEECGSDIVLGRLEANPAAKRCMQCASK